MQDDQTGVEALFEDAQPGSAEVLSGDRRLHSDPHDFAGLYIRHRSSFTLHARRYLRDQRDADEVVQEAFLRLFLALPELETELQALAYCRRTITNLCIDRYRAQARRPTLIDLDSVRAEDLADDEGDDPVVRAEDAATVRAALSLLSPLHREALVKREIEEKTLPVIAAELDIPEESVKHVLFRARRALRRILASTSLAPGSDAEFTAALGRVLSKGSGGLAALVVLVALALSTGPDLRAIPVAGQALPDLPAITDIARAVGEVLSGGKDAPPPATAAGDGGSGANAGTPGGDGTAGLLPVPAPTPTAAATSTVGLLPSPAGPTPAVAPSPTALPSPSVLPSPTALPSPTVPASPSARPSPSVEPTRAPTREPSPSSESTRPSRPASPSAAPSPTTTAGASGSGRAGAPKRTSSASSPDPEAWDTPGLSWQIDPETQQPVLLPVGQSPGQFGS